MAMKKVVPNILQNETTETKKHAASQPQKCLGPPLPPAPIIENSQEALQLAKQYRQLNNPPK